MGSDGKNRPEFNHLIILDSQGRITQKVLRPFPYIYGWSVAGQRGLIQLGSDTLISMSNDSVIQTTQINSAQPQVSVLYQGNEQFIEGPLKVSDDSFAVVTGSGVTVLNDQGKVLGAYKSVGYMQIQSVFLVDIHHHKYLMAHRELYKNFCGGPFEGDLIDLSPDKSGNLAVDATISLVTPSDFPRIIPAFHSFNDGTILGYGASQLSFYQYLP